MLISLTNNMHLELMTEKQVKASAKNGEVIPLALAVSSRPGANKRGDKQQAEVLCAVDTIHGVSCETSCGATDDAGPTAILLPEGRRFHPLPEQRDLVAEHIHITGPSGCGKSTYAGEFARRFRKEGGFVLVASADPEDDPALPLGDACDCRVGLDSLVANREALLGPGGSALDEVWKLAAREADHNGADEPAKILVVFDDVEGTGRDTAEVLGAFRQALLERGRKARISTLNIFHRAASGRATRDSLSEASKFVVFPRAGLPRNTLYALKEYGGLSGDSECRRLKKRHWGRAVTVSRTYPPALIGERAACLLA